MKPADEAAVLCRPRNSMNLSGLEESLVSKTKVNRVRKLSRTAQYPRTFEARLANIPAELVASLTAAQIASVIDGPMATSYSAGHSTGYRDAR